MATVLTLNTTLNDIVTEAKTLDKQEQESLLAYIRALRISKKKVNPVTVRGGKKPLSMSQIDKIKHLSRRNEA